MALPVLDFPASPAVGDRYPTPVVTGQPQYRWDGQVWLATDAAADATDVSVAEDQPFTEAQKAQARKNIYAAPFDAMAYSGMQINGSMEVSQENGSTSFVLSSGVPKYVVDGFSEVFIGTGTVGAAQVPLTNLPGFSTGVLMNCTVANPLAGANDGQWFYQPIEGFRFSQLAWGTANAQPITIGFWVFPTVSGTMAVAARSAVGSGRTYVVDVPITAGSWQFKTITIPGDTTTGTWNAGNGTGCTVSFCFGAGSGRKASAANTWLTGDQVGSPSTTNFFATTATIYFTGVVVLPGIEAPSAVRSPLIMRPYDQELVTCKQYWQSVGDYTNTFPVCSGNPGAGVNFQTSFLFSVEMRANPTGLKNGTWATSNCGQPFFNGVPVKTGFVIAATATAAGAAYVYPSAAGQNLTFNARL